MCKLFGLGVFEPVDDLEKELIEFLARNRADLKVVEALSEKIGDFVRNGGFSDIKGLIDVECQYFLHGFS